MSLVRLAAALIATGITFTVAVSAAQATPGSPDRPTIARAA